MSFPFSDHIALVEHFLDSRQTIVDTLERQLFSGRGKTCARSGDRESIAGIFDDGFFESPTVSRNFSRLKGTLEAAHLAEGFEPARQDGYARGLDPVELALRACHHWDVTRWPGRNGRLVYADGLYSVFVLRLLEGLSLRIWDGWSLVSGHWSLVSGHKSEAAARLCDVQRLLDRLNTGGNALHRNRMVRDARWLIQTAQGPLTRHVRPYFLKADQVSGSLTGEDRIEVHKAGAVLAGGHLRSQLRHLSRRTGWASDDRRLVALTRSSNSMDMALLVRDLVPLLDAYTAACDRDDVDVRLALADAILQGLSVDPELLLTRLDLLGPSTLIEDLFVERGDTAAAYTATGERHREYLARYGELVGRAATSLQQDSRTFDAANRTYSPFGLVYGFCADLLSNMVLATLGSTPLPDLSLEDMFISREKLEEKRVVAHAWQQLPKRQGEPDPFEHSTEWAGRINDRLGAALEARAAHPSEPNASNVRKSRLYVVPRGVAVDSLPDGALPRAIVSAQEHCLTSDVTHARATGGTALPADRLAADRAEGRLLASDGDAVWFGISKVPLTLCTSQGTDALFTDVPAGVVEVLRLACPDFLVVVRGEP